MSREFHQLPEVVTVKPLPRTERKEIQRWYDQAVQFAAHGDSQSCHEAHRRLAACLDRDPGNSLYTELMLRNFAAWERPLKRPGWWKSSSWRREVSRGEQQRDW